MVRREKTVYESKEFLKLREEWYGKLKKKGFKDIEYTDWEDGSSGNLLAGYGHMDAVRFYSQDVTDYFYRANQYLREVRRHWGVGSPEHVAWKIHSRCGPLREVKEALGVSMKEAKRIVGKVRMNMYQDGAKVDTGAQLNLLEYTLVDIPDEEDQ